MKKKIITGVCLAVGLILLVAAIFILGSLGKKQEAGQPKILGLVMTVTEDAWKDELDAAIIAAAGQWEVTILPFMAERNQNGQIDALRALMAYQADVIVFSPLVERGWDKMLLEAEQAGIPVIAVDKAVRPGRDGLTASYVGYDYYGAAVKAAENLLRYGKEDAVIMELCGTTGAYSAREITRGFRETLEKDGRFQIDYSVCGEFMRSKSKEIVEGMFASGHTIDILICHNDAMTLGAVEAIKEAGKTPGKDVRIYAFGGSREVADLVAQGQVQCLVRCDTSAAGAKTLEAAARLLREDGEEKQEIILIDTVLLTKEAGQND